MIAQILCVVVGVLIAIGLLAAVFGAKSWFDRLVQRHEDAIRNLHGRIDCINRRLDRLDDRFEALCRYCAKEYEAKHPDEPDKDGGDKSEA